MGGTSNGFNGWNGQLDDLHIYRRALSQTEVAALYNPPAVESYDSWLAAQAMPVPAGQHAATGDPGADGVPNLLEYALAGDPMSAVSTPPPVASASNFHLQLSFTRHRADLD